MRMGFVALALLVACQPSGERASGPADVALETEEAKTAYSLGFALGRNLAPLQLSAAELAALQAGILDASAKAEPRVDVQQYADGIQKLASARAKEAASQRREADAAFLAAEAAKQGARRFDSGLIYASEHEGDGAQPGASDTVQVHYHGTLPDGTVFDSSRQRGQPATFPVNGVIPCWTEALQQMKAGGKARVVCPPEIAYGERGAPPRIPPGATLVFEIDLLAVEKK